MDDIKEYAILIDDTKNSDPTGLEFPEIVAELNQMLKDGVFDKPKEQNDKRSPRKRG